MKVLVVGAGAVGQVFGRHLVRGGAELSFLVKPKYRDAAERGYQMYCLRSVGAAQQVQFSDFGVFDDPTEASAVHWDQVWLTVPADALVGPWLDAFITRLHSDCVIVCLSPGHETYCRLQNLVGSERLVSGMINLISYQAPLAGEDRFVSPGVAYWLPPLTASPFSGPPEHVQRICATLKAGGQPATQHSDVQRAVEFPQAILMTHLLALEASGWRFKTLRQGDALVRARRGALQAMSIMAAKKGVSTPWWLPVWRPFMGRLGLRCAPTLVPLDLETYIEYHFKKVRSQTILFVNQYIEWGQQLGQPTHELRALLAAVGPEM